MREKHYKKVNGVFKKQSKEKWKRDWILNADKLANLTSNEFAAEIKEEFDDMSDTSYFNAQLIEVSGINSLGGEFRYFQLSLGHHIYSHHFTFRPHDKSWHRTIINQEFFENIVKPFQMKQTRKARYR